MNLPTLQKKGKPPRWNLGKVWPDDWRRDTFCQARRHYKKLVAQKFGEVVYNGQVGTVCGIPVIATKALTDTAYVMSAEAVKLFMKKDVEVEQDRDADTRTNSVYLRTAYIVALGDATKICMLRK